MNSQQLGGKRPPRGYIAGPMRGYVNSNFPAFDEAKARGIAKGFVIVSPADLSRRAGYTGDESPENVTPHELHEFAKVDVGILLELDAERGDFLAVLPGWQASVGARMEVGIALFKRLPILSAVDFEPVKVGLFGTNIARFKPNRQAVCFRPPEGVVRDDGTVRAAQALADGEI